MKFHLAQIIKIDAGKTQCDISKTECNSNHDRGTIIRNEKHYPPSRFLKDARKYPKEVCLKCLKRFKAKYPHITV
jgi:hypothetical protein